MVSIIVPIYNTGEYLEKCITSLLNQTCQDIEILLIDDGSTDGSSEICDVYLNKDSRVRVFHQKNQGVSAARNFGINEARGEWICFVDGDDYVTLDMVDNLLSTALHRDSDICIGDYYVVRGNNKPEYAEFIINKKLLYFSKFELIENSLIGNGLEDNVSCVGVPWAKIYRSKFIKENKLYFENGLKRNQDVVFNLYAFQYAEKVSYSKHAVYFYRIWESSVMRKYSPDFDITTNHIISRFYEFIKKFGLTGKEYQTLLDIRTMDMFHECLWLKVFHRDFPYQSKKQYREFREMCVLFTGLFAKCNSCTYKKGRYIKYFLVRYRCYSLLYVLLVLKSKLQKKTG